MISAIIKLITLWLNSSSLKQKIILQLLLNKRIFAVSQAPSNLNSDSIQQLNSIGLIMVHNLITVSLC